MLPASRRSLLAIAAVVDVALHARASPVAASALAARHRLPPRHLEPVLQALVRHGILKGLRGPRGGYELARERRRITVGDVVRAAMSASAREEASAPDSRLVQEVVTPVLRRATEAFLAELDRDTIDDLCRKSRLAQETAARQITADFTI